MITNFALGLVRDDLLLEACSLASHSGHLQRSMTGFSVGGSLKLRGEEVCRNNELQVGMKEDDKGMSAIVTKVSRK